MVMMMLMLMLVMMMLMVMMVMMVIYTCTCPDLSLHPPGQDVSLISVLLSSVNKENESTS